MSPTASEFTPAAAKEEVSEPVLAIAEPTKEELKQDEAPIPTVEESKQEEIIPVPATLKGEEAVSTPSKEETKEEEAVLAPSTPVNSKFAASEPEKDDSIPILAEDVSSEPDVKIESPLKPVPMPTPEVAPVMPEPTKKEASAPPSPIISSASIEPEHSTILDSSEVEQDITKDGNAVEDKEDTKAIVEPEVLIEKAELIAE